MSLNSKEKIGFSFYEDHKSLQEGKLRQKAAGRAEEIRPAASRSELRLHLLSQEGLGPSHFLIPFRELFRIKECLDALAKGAASFPDLGNNF